MIKLFNKNIILIKKRKLFEKIKLITYERLHNLISSLEK